MRIGIFGGSFDPFHEGHLAIACAAKEQYCLDKVIFVPAFMPPNKTGADMTPAKHRLEMVRLATGPFAGFEVSEIELLRTGISYTIDTLRLFKKQYPNSRLFFIAGADTFKTLSSWKEPEKILELCEFLVAPRIQGGEWAESARVHSIQMAEHPVSSTEIRQCLKQRDPEFSRKIPKKVFAYIQKNQLYLK